MTVSIKVFAVKNWVHLSHLKIQISDLEQSCSEQIGTKMPNLTSHIQHFSGDLLNSLVFKVSLSDL